MTPAPRRRQVGRLAGGREKAPAAICRKVTQAKLSGSNEIEIWLMESSVGGFMYIDDRLEYSAGVRGGNSDNTLIRARLGRSRGSV